jgi:hypothetical protein
MYKCRPCVLSTLCKPKACAANPYIENADWSGCGDNGKTGADKATTTATNAECSVSCLPGFEDRYSLDTGLVPTPNTDDKGGPVSTDDFADPDYGHAW